LLSPITRTLVLAAAIALTVSLPASGLPPAATSLGHVSIYRGPIHWQVILCQFSDSANLAQQNGISPQPLHDLDYYTGLFFTAGTLGLQDYVKAVSYETASVTGSVHGWYTEPRTFAQAKARHRFDHLMDCIKAAERPPSSSTYGPQPAAYTPPKDDRIYVITSPGVDLVGFNDRGAVGQDWGFQTNSNGTIKIQHGTALPEIAHEFGHGIGLAHSFSNDFASRHGGAPGEYDNQWDLMSAANIFADPTKAFGGGPPFLDAHHLDELGWLAMRRVSDIGVGTPGATTVTLAALTHPDAKGFLEARIFFDPKDRFHYYTVEFRVADSWDSGLSGGRLNYPEKMILINEVAYWGGDHHNLYIGYLQRAAGDNPARGVGMPDQSLNANGITISVQSMSADQATVRIATTRQITFSGRQDNEYGPHTCSVGYVWRAADDLDYVCVTAAIRDQTRADNAAATSRHKQGSDECIEGYVWRGAFPGDRVCVAPQSQLQAQQDNSQALRRLMMPNS
jgi:M6 family metalloprotease-like protein